MYEFVIGARSLPPRALARRVEEAVLLPERRIIDSAVKVVRDAADEARARSDEAMREQVSDLEARSPGSGRRRRRRRRRPRRSRRRVGWLGRSPSATCTSTPASPSGP